MLAEIILRQFGSEASAFQPESGENQREGNDKGEESDPEFTQCQCPFGTELSLAAQFRQLRGSHERYL